MSIKHLHELLQEDQEPFHIIDFIANHRYQLKSSTTTTIDTTVFLHVPAMLRDAAMRVQQQSSTKNSGLFQSFFKLLKHKTTQHTHHVTNYYPSEKFHRTKMVSHNFRGPNVKGSDHESRFPHSYKYNDRNRVSSEEWSEKLSESETTCSPSSPFRFCLLKTPSPCSRTPDFLSPMMSPNCFFGQDKDKQSQEISVDDDEQCSPISVLDPSHKDDFERSYSSIQRTKDQLLETLLRFERLVELDPIVLERHLLEQCYKEEHDLGVEKSPSHVKRLALDITIEEKIKEEQVGREIVVRRVCGRLNSWNMVKSKAIGTIVEFEFRSENGEEWKRCDGELNVREIGMHIDVAIFEELLQEFVTSFGE